MKIAILQGPCLPVPPLQGGAVEKLWYALGQQFAEAGHQVTHISRTWTGLPDRDMQGGVQHVRIRGFDAHSRQFVNKIRDFGYTLRAAKAIPGDIDLVVTNTFWAPIVLSWRSRMAIYVSVERMPKGQMRFYRRAAKLRAPSSAVARAIAKELPENEAARICLIPNPLPFDTRDLSPVDWPRKEKSILYCGRVHPEKGLHLLRELVSKLPQDWRLDIVGPWDFQHGGGGDDYLSSLKNLLGENAHVKFHGAVYEKSRLLDYYSRASIFVYPSVAERGEALPLAPLEAMACGCVPVVSSLECFSDYLHHGINGMSFNYCASDAGDQLAKEVLGLVSDPSVLDRLARAALAVRHSHAPDRVAQMFLDDFRDVIGDRVPAS